MILSFVVVLMTGCSSPETHMGSDRASILVIGDSISIGYTPFVQAELPDRDVYHNPGNAQWTAHTLGNLSQYLSTKPGGKYSLITWNNGLHDITHNTPGVITTDIVQYEANLRVIGSILVAQNVPVIFFTTTHVPTNDTKRSEADVIAYNAVAVRVMNDLGIRVYDLHAVSLTIQHLHVDAHLQNDIHYIDAGSEVLGQFVTDSIKDNL